MKDIASVILFIICLFLGALFFRYIIDDIKNISKETGRHEMRVEAVKLGLAQWKVDENGISSFSWKVEK